jgi:hypothetical protein
VTVDVIHDQSPLPRSNPGAFVTQCAGNVAKDNEHVFSIYNFAEI